MMLGFCLLEAKRFHVSFTFYVYQVCQTLSAFGHGPFNTYNEVMDNPLYPFVGLTVLVDDQEAFPYMGQFGSFLVSQAPLLCTPSKGKRFGHNLCPV